tara:strand:+ start:3270 stop:5774 length:2505 start_codon:yes stop_codon:yes gene_type:complete
MSVGIPYYEIKDCCNGQSAIVNITGGVLADGVYSWTLPTTSFTYGPNNQLSFILEQTKCYIVKFRGTQLSTTYPTVDSAGLSVESLGTFNDCLSAPTCPDCNSSNYYLKAEPCCGGPAVFFKGQGFPNYPSIPQFSINLYPGVWKFTNYSIPGQPPLPPGLGNQLLVNHCYRFSANTVDDPTSEITLAEWQLLDYPPFVSQMAFIDKDFCQNDPGAPPPDPDVLCEPCDSICYVLTDCDGTIIETTLDFSAYVGQYVTLDGYTGTFLVEINEVFCANPDTTLVVTGIATDPCPCICYEVTGIAGSINYIDCDGNGQVTYPPAKFCAQSPPIIKELPGQSYTLTTGTPCVDGECTDKCFVLINCDPDEYPSQTPMITSTTQSLSQYVSSGEIVVLSNYDGCWTVEEATCQCILIEINGDVYEAKAVSIYNGQKVYSFTFGDLTYYIWATAFPGGWAITATIGSGTELGSIASGIVGCPTADDTIWIKGVGPDGEPIVSIATTLCEDQCDCAVDVTVIQDYRSCSECIGTIAYKLTNCEKINEVVYTTQDLSAYVGKVIKDDCDCWTVEQIDYQPPSTTVINNIIPYTDCTSCLTTYYQLDDCDELSTFPTIITGSDLSAYVGQTVTIEGCDGCYTVSLYTEDAEPAASQNVTVTASFVDCITCGTVTPRCSTVFNSDVTDQAFSYIDVNGDTQVTDVIRSGETSLRYCVQRWIDPKQKGVFNYYGDCTVFEEKGLPKSAFCTQYFPNDRKVKPGYNTPICSAEKYDKITCKFAEIAYKQALELRYGISNCCPEEDEKWLIKKELIELQALTDPDYICDIINDCCNTTDGSSSCNS